MRATPLLLEKLAKTLTVDDIEHSLRVAHSVQKKVMVVALFHDLFEAGVTFEWVFEGQASREERQALAWLTRRDGESYDEYIEQIASLEGETGEIAREVKIADLEDNLARMDGEHESLRPRYEKALKRLEVSR